MSYILDALKKAERERGLRQIPTIMSVHAPGIGGRSRLWLFLGALVICAGIAIWFTMPSRKAPPAVVSQQSPGQQKPNANLPDASQVAAAIPADRSPAAPFPSQLREDQKTEPDPRRPAQPKIAPRNENARHISQPAMLPADIPSLIGDVPEDIVIPPAELIHIQRQLRAAGVNAPQAEDNPKSDTRQEKPATLKEAVGKMNLSLLYYSDVKTERTVFINGRKYKEGDYVEGAYLLESITLEGATLSYQGEKAILRPLPK